jgi:2OG-Fe(II) oxygenase superfamily
MFVQWMSRLTGLDGLLADPTLEGGGMQRCGPGGFLNIHADFTTHHHQTNWRRRVNLIVYLNRDWNPTWGGALELWDRAMTRCVVRVPPFTNHAVIFNTDKESYHGFPDSVTCPAGVTRNSIALYYYTAEPDAEIIPRSTNYQARPQDGRLQSALIWADKELLHAYSAIKSRLRLTDDFASRALGFLARSQNRRR